MLHLHKGCSQEKLWCFFWPLLKLKLGTDIRFKDYIRSYLHSIKKVSKMPLKVRLFFLNPKEESTRNLPFFVYFELPFRVIYCDSQ
jgi:hypothetical protein